MPDLPPETVNKLRKIAEEFLTLKFKGWALEGEPRVGGSGAVFKAVKGSELRAIKVSAQKLFEGEGMAAELKRTGLQQRLIDHNCASLVKIYALELFSDTCICLMEHLSWVELKDAAGTIPSKNIQPIVDQLVDAVTFLKSVQLIHRDIKPENILINSDLKTIKLVDLGVIREMSNNDNQPDSTDHGSHRPFLATAQYSSPEYLFRTVEPSESLWEALNLYQIGAVVHDLIEEKEIFADEMLLGNRYRLALAVLSKCPVISVAKRQRNRRLADIAEACLVKNLTTRLKIVTLKDFYEPKGLSPDQQLKSALALMTHKGQSESRVSLLHQVESKKIEESLDKISNHVFNKLNDEFRTDLQIYWITAQNTSTSRLLCAGIPPASIEYKFTIEAEQNEDFEITSEVKILLRNDKEINSACVQGTFSLNAEVEPESWVVKNLYQSISETLVKSITK